MGKDPGQGPEEPGCLGLFMFPCWQAASLGCILATNQTAPEAYL